MFIPAVSSIDASLALALAIAAGAVCSTSIDMGSSGNFCSLDASGAHAVDIISMLTRSNRFMFVP
jgi:hypothetical protein